MFSNKKTKQELQNKDQNIARKKKYVLILDD